VVVVTPGTQVARLSCAFVIQGHLFETGFLRQNRARRVHGLLQEVQILASIVQTELLVLGRPFLR